MNSPSLRTPASIPRFHLLAYVISHLTGAAAGNDGSVVRNSDVGCGNGNPIAHLNAFPVQMHPLMHLKIYSFDVVGHGVQGMKFIEQKVACCITAVPDVYWSRAIYTSCATAVRPFDNDIFKVVLPNQMFEHVHGHEGFFRQAHWVLKTGGAPIRLFLLKHCAYQGPLHLPWVHRIRFDISVGGFVALLSRRGLGKYPANPRETGCSLDVSTNRHADYLFFWTRYMSAAEALDTVRKADLRISYRYTGVFYLQKIFSLLRRPSLMAYRHEGRNWSEAVAVKILRFFSSITPTCDKPCRY